MDSDFPADIQDKLDSFHQSILSIERDLKPLLDFPISDMKEKVNLFDRATLDLVTVYSLNSLFWMYLISIGEDPKEHGIKQELDRVKSYMVKLKEIKEKVNAPKINTGAAKRFVRNALWMPKNKEGDVENQSKDKKQTHDERISDKNSGNKRRKMS